MEYRFHCWDIPAKKKVYGETPVFVFDQKDESNRLPQDPDYAVARERWAWCPRELRDTFIRAFSDGLRDPDRRVTEGEWQGLFSRIKDRIATCPRCRAENFSGPYGGIDPCWHCHTAVTPPPVLSIHRQSGTIPLLLALGTTLRKRHISPVTPLDDGAEVVGKVVPHPSIAGAAGIRNLSKETWDITFPDGRTTKVPPDRAVPLHAGTTIIIEGIALTILAPGEGVIS
jgi:hypothetical protein